MADDTSYAEVLSDMAKILRCGVCLEIQMDSRCLQCGHHFCYECLRLVYKAAKCPGFVRCPVCAGDTVLEDVSELPAVKDGVELILLFERFSSFSNLRRVSDVVRHEVGCEDEVYGVPFSVNDSLARKCFSDWISGLNMKPLDFDSHIGDVIMEPIFVNTYEVMMNANSSYQANVSIGGSVRNITGDHGARYCCNIYANDEIPINMRTMLEENNVEAIRDIGLSKDINERNIRMLECTMEDSEAIILAENKIHTEERNATKDYLIQMARGAINNVMSLSCRIEFNQRTVNQKLMPIYLGSYSFKQKTYQFVVNGITGDVVGDFPKSNVKKLEGLFKLLIFLGVVMVLIFLLQRRQNQILI